MTTDKQTMDRIASRDGLDLIAQELKSLEFDAVIENTGGFTLWVAVYGAKGYIVANDTAVFFYTHEADSEGEDLKYRDEYQPVTSWVRQVAETFTDYAHRLV